MKGYQWDRTDADIEFNASIFYQLSVDSRDFVVWLKKDKTDKKWYYDAGEDTTPTWIPLDVANATEAKRVVEVLIRME